MKKIILIGILVLILAVVGFSVWKYKFVGDNGNILEKENLIWVSEPLPNTLVQSPLMVKGEARGNWFFEASFPVKVIDENGKELGTGIARALSDWMTEDFVPFEADLEFQLSATKKGTLILEKDNPSGLPENADELRIPVLFNPVEMIKVEVYFNNDKLDPEFSCNKVFPVEREIPKTQAVARAALEELLKGSTDTEKEEGFFTSINPGVKIQSLAIEDGIAKVDFDKQLEFQIGGSCRVAAIRAQIRETLKQFPTVDEVIISIDGRTEDILQP
ncbi:MAG: hypothetical protein COU41_00720 [Candidatus Nealsonbacteria bacterium CG10_big_fil_rev_8_21_14_0_10_36_228]|uniref:GerMN domain-containing protein n=3 Tax=Candidatus Nealsoniibacteriota TaxID=1817911 RepID=A0A2M8DL40_9BACT|nr:MAG: hypothetical protein COU41_00720 [Candidatus Nealsonbacteria bacterium CG10_big_fil_rev_8_21_14_0_10_36_228]PIX88549.1 MAG: hypothetical protein COZ30_00525 [Candidatus Nealsonbacteria bacterium CG_4_10_14_3_um_filter_36_16]PJB98351.1 MAG: hypothetical protein CO078_02030 [Candidatus Nealsonbacteria bacterium CG_4_9_14_0_8_um_filter_36_17]